MLFEHGLVELNLVSKSSTRNSIFDTLCTKWTTCSCDFENFEMNDFSVVIKRVWRYQKGNQNP